MGQTMAAAQAKPAAQGGAFPGGSAAMGGEQTAKDGGSPMKPGNAE